MKISKKTRDIISYLVGGTVVFIGTILLIAIATGWQYDIRTGELRETGLILMGSEPAGATIRVNDQDITQVTNYRYQNAPLGNYALSYQKAGYRPWKAQVEATAGEVTFADYAWLIPNEVPTRQRYADFSFTTAIQSTDRKRFVFIEQRPATTPGVVPPPRLFTSTDLSRPPVLLLDPSSTPSQATIGVTGYDSLQMSEDGSQLLIRATLKDGSIRWQTLATNPSSTPALRDITQDFTINPSWIAWWSTSNTELSYLEKGVLRRLQLRDQRISEALASNVVHASWSKEWLVMITQPQSTGAPELRIRAADSNDNQLVSKLASQNTAYLTKYFRVLNRDYLAVLGSETKTITLFSNVLRDSDRQTSSIVARNTTAFTVSPDGRFLVHNANERLVTIDFERYRRYRFDTPLTGLTNWSWMNDQHLAMLSDGKLRLVDYDGQNNELLAENVNPASPILFSENKSLLTFTQPVADPASTTKLQQLFLNPEKILE